MNLKEFRKSRGLTQVELANATGCTRQNISYIEKSNREPTVEVAKKIAATYGVDWTIFFERERNYNLQASNTISNN